MISDYDYAPQAKVNNIEVFTINSGESITLTTTVRGAQNHYKWFKDGVEIPEAPDSPNYVLDPASPCYAGVYHSEITSDLVPFQNSNPPGTDGKNLLLIRNDITLNVNSVPETCTSLTNPMDGATDVPLNQILEWAQSNEACGYFLSIGTTSGGIDILNNADVGNVTSYNLGFDLPPNQTIYVTITPYFISGNVVTCAEESFSTGNTTLAPPNCTTLSSPVDGSSDIVVDTAISWNAVADATGYVLSIGTTSGGTEILAPTDVGNSTTYNPTSDLPEGITIYVTLLPYNAGGNAMGCTEESFTTETACVPPAQPTTACWETATFNTVTCSWEVTGTQPAQPTVECWETTTFNTATCSWDVTGAQPAQPTLECWETATFNTATCSWEVTGTQPVQPATACWETATFNTATCSWDVTGTPPEPVEVLDDVTECGSYSLPNLNVGSYYTGPNGTGLQLSEGATITNSQTIYIYNTYVNCEDESSFEVTILDAPEFELALSNIEIDGLNITVNMQDTSIDYRYAVDDLNFQESNMFFNLEEGFHILTVTNGNNCVQKAIRFEIKIERLNIPKFFTPNGDGNNDQWVIEDPKNEVKVVYIFNRYGKLLKTFSGNALRWNGSYTDGKLPTDDYWYLIELQNGDSMRGHFTLKK